MKSTIAWAAATLATASCLFAGGAAAQPRGRLDFGIPGETPPNVSIRRVIQDGSGCLSLLSPKALLVNKNALVVESDPMEAKVAPGASLEGSYVFCTTLIELDHTAGWSYAVTFAPVRGFAALDPGIHAVAKTEYFFPGELGVSFETKLDGPFHNIFGRIDVPVVDEETGPWSPCDGGKPLVIVNSARVSRMDNRNASGLLMMTPPGDAMTYSLRWKRCP